MTVLLSKTRPIVPDAASSTTGSAAMANIATMRMCTAASVPKSAITDPSKSETRRAPARSARAVTASMMRKKISAGNRSASAENGDTSSSCVSANGFPRAIREPRLNCHCAPLHPYGLRNMTAAAPASASHGARSRGLASVLASA